MKFLQHCQSPTPKKDVRTYLCLQLQLKCYFNDSQNPSNDLEVYIEIVCVSNSIDEIIFG